MKRMSFIIVILVLLAPVSFSLKCIVQTGGMAAAYGATDKMALWKGATQLRGANIFQRRVYKVLDGTEFMGSGYVGPPYTGDDFRRLAASGANLVVISHPGLFDIKPPYSLNRELQSNLDGLLGMIAKEDMFAVIAFRTGPGRSPFTFHLDETGDWFEESHLDDSVWERRTAQDA